MSRYDEPDEHEDAGGYPASGGRPRTPLGRRRDSEDTGSWTGLGRRRASEDTGSWTSRRRGRAGSDGPDPAARRGGGAGAIFSRHPVVSVLAIALTVVLTGASLTAYAAYRSVYDRIQHVVITSGQLGNNRPPELVPGALNILLIGSDSRAGTNGQYGSASVIQGSRSDTSMVLHISPDHTHAVVISFPRDSLVPIYSCKNDGQGHTGQQAQPGQEEALNWTFSFGGVPCLWRTIEQASRIRIDYFAEVDFSGFKKIVNDVGGVQVCLPFSIDNPQSGLRLSAGVHTVTGAQALAFVRLREGVGYGSDTQRIQRQQFFLASALQKVKQTNIVTDPQRIYSVVRDAASSLTTNMSLTNLLALADSLKGLNTSSVQFITVPVVDDPNPANYGRVDWIQPQADQLFSAIRHDTKIPKSAKKTPKAGAKAAATAKPTPTAQPSQVQVSVLNGTSTPGLAGSTASALANLGFTVTGTGDAANTNYADSVIEYSSSSQMPEVYALEKQVLGAQVKRVAGLSPGTLTLILGSSFSKLGQKPTTSSSGSTSGMSSLAQNYGGFSADANICSDQQAFAGPDTPTVP